jgi:transcriptional regulator with XRE-family HTH domain
MSQRALAGPFSAAFVSRIELGDAVPSLPALAYLVERLEVPLDEFFARVSAFGNASTREGQPELGRP